MNILLREVNVSDGSRRTLIKSTVQNSLLLNAVPDIFLEQGCYYSYEKVWDCVIDLVYENAICNRHNDKNRICEILIIMQNDFSVDLEYHSFLEILGLLLNEMSSIQRNYTITIKEKDDMEDYKYHVECPPFGKIDKDYRKEKKTVRRYCHPADEKIIGVLDNPAVNAIFRSMADFGADSSFGQMIAGGIPVNFNNYPEEDAIIRHCSECLGIRRPYTIISSQLPGINAMTVGSDDEPYLVLSSLLVKTMSLEQLKFVVGHECGHIAMGHVVYHSAVATAGSLSQLIPIIGPTLYSLVAFPMNAWERRSEITADRAGLLCCMDVELAQRTLLQIESAFQNADILDINGYIENSHRYLRKGTLRRLGEYGANHPLISKRMDALKVFANSKCYLELSGQAVTENALTDQQLERETENIIKVL